MKIIESVSEMQARSLGARRDGERIGLVPTMGSLHEGHLSLVRLAREFCDLLVVSAFVNPTQFGPEEDLATYPSDPAGDEDACLGAGVDVLFRPSGEDMYAPDHSVHVEESDLSSGLCGALRPGHFRGVTTVVAKLLNIVLPDVAVFGQKDAQQAAVIRRMVRDLNFPVRIVLGPTVREADGLAMSSRNAYLSAGDRDRATAIHRALQKAESDWAAGERDAARIVRDAEETIRRAIPDAEIDYVEAVDVLTLHAAKKNPGALLLAVAVRICGARLIDNVVLGEAGLALGPMSGEALGVHQGPREPAQPGREGFEDGFRRQSL